MAEISLRQRPPQHGHRTRGSRAGVDHFIALDGEGETRDGQHFYTLLGVGPYQIENRDGLSWNEILEFLYSHYSKKSAYVGFFLGYDFTEWFRQLPEERARMLLTIEGRAKRKRRVNASHNIAPHPVEYSGWQFDILGTRRLRIRPKSCDCRIQSCSCKPKSPWMYICDSGGFFQTSLVNVINPANWKEPIVTQEEFETICRGKARRGGEILSAEDREYNRLENEILQRLMRELDHGFRNLGIVLSPSQYYGPGQAAQEWLKNQGIPTREQMEEIAKGWPTGLLAAAIASYFGGWFELFIHGHIKGESHEYDINNAYPYIISRLPCLQHGTWEHGIGRPNVAPGQFCLVRARIQTAAYGTSYFDGRKHYVGAMLHRDERGRISRPKITEGWFWWHELEAAKKARCISRISDDRLYEWFTYTPCSCDPPAREMASLYQVRLRMGKNSSIGKAAKLVANSAYGKFAQSVGHPLFGNPVYASLITAGCRTMILNAIATHPRGKRDVAMVATDGVFFLHEHPRLPVSERLGEWSHKTRTNLTLFKPGVYWDESTRRQIAEGRNPVFKARGINAKAFGSQIAAIDRQFSDWDRTGPPRYHGNDPDLHEKGSATWPQVEYRPEFGMTSALQALMQNQWDKAGQLLTYDEPLKQLSHPFDKRQANVYYDAEDGVYRSEPKNWGSNCYMSWDLAAHCPRDYFASVPYQKGFGYTDAEMEESEWGISPQGPIGQLFREALGIS